MTATPSPSVSVNEGSPAKKRKENIEVQPQHLHSNGAGSNPYPQHYYPTGGGPSHPSNYYSHQQQPAHYQTNLSGMPIGYCQPTETWRGGSGPRPGTASTYRGPGPQAHMFPSNSVNNIGVGYMNGNGSAKKSSHLVSKTPHSLPDHGQSAIPGPSSVTSASRRDKDVDHKDKGRGSYRCGKCGVPKKGHVCPYQPKLKRRADEPPPEMRNAATQVEMDEFLVVRRLNLEIQGFPESYTAEPVGDVGVEVHAHPMPMPQHSSSNGTTISYVSIEQGNQTHRIMGSPNASNGANSSRNVGVGGQVALLPPRPTLSSSSPPNSMTSTSEGRKNLLHSLDKDDCDLNGRDDRNET